MMFLSRGRGSCWCRKFRDDSIMKMTLLSSSAQYAKKKQTPATFEPDSFFPLEVNEASAGGTCCEVNNSVRSIISCGIRFKMQNNNKCSSMNPCSAYLLIYRSESVEEGQTSANFWVEQKLSPPRANRAAHCRV